MRQAWPSEQDLFLVKPSKTGRNYALPAHAGSIRAAIGTKLGLGHPLFLLALVGLASSAKALDSLT